MNKYQLENLKPYDQDLIREAAWEEGINPDSYAKNTDIVARLMGPTFGNTRFHIRHTLDQFRRPPRRESDPWMDDLED